MQDLVKRYFWILGVLTVMTCAVFAAKAVNHVVEAKYLGDAAQAPKIVPVTLAAPVTLKPVRSKDGTQLAVRNMFCSDCTPPPPTLGGAGGDPANGVPMTTLPLQLIATSVDRPVVASGLPPQIAHRLPGASLATPKPEPQDLSFATVINTESQHQGSYSLGDIIPGAGPLRAVHYKYIDFENNGHLERLAWQGATPPPVVAVAAEAPAGDGDEMTASLNNGIKKIDDTHFEIDKNLLDKVLQNPMAMAKGARIVPAVKAGKPDGFKLYAIKPSSAFALLGLTNGDTLQSINGFALDSADSALTAYTKLKEATHLEISITRRGKPLALDYTIR